MKDAIKTLTFITAITLHICIVRSKPLQQNSNDRLLDYDQQNNNNNADSSDVSPTVGQTVMMDDAEDGVLVGGDMDFDDFTVSSPAAMDKLKKATEAVNEFRQMLNERMLFMNGGKTGENFKFSGALPSIGHQPINSDANNGDASAVVPVNKRTEQQQHSRRKHHRQHKNQRKQQQQQLYQRDKGTDTVLDSMNSMNGNDEDDDAARGGSSSLATAFKINANLYRSPTENTQNFMATGRESEARFNLPNGLFASPLECPRMHNKVTQLLCPSRRRHGYHVCIDETALCNGKSECPNGEDEDSVNCMFYKTTMKYFKTVVDQVVQLSDHILHSRRRGNEEL